MQIQDVIRAFYDYNEWANNRLLTGCEKLTPEQFSESQGVSWDSVETNLAHIVAAQNNWLSRWRTGRNARAITEVQAITGLGKLRQEFDESHAALREFVAGLTDAQLAQSLAFTDSSDTAHESLLWELMLHVANHGTYHRAEVAMALSILGNSPGDLDYRCFEVARAGSKGRP